MNLKTLIVVACMFEDITYLHGVQLGQERKLNQVTPIPSRIFGLHTTLLSYNSITVSVLVSRGSRDEARNDIPEQPVLKDANGS